MNLKTNAIIIRKPFCASFESLTVSIPSSHHLIVDVDMCGICTPELRMFRGVNYEKLPYWGGHELFGEIKDIVTSNTTFNIGDKVLLFLMDRCGECVYCLNGLDNHCSYVNRVSNKKMDSYYGPRGFSSSISVPNYKAFLAPNEIPLEYLTLIEPTACVIRSVKMSTPNNNNVAIIGSGTMGLIHSIVLKSLGYNVFVFDEREEDLLKAEKIQLSSAYSMNLLDKGVLSELTDGLGISTFFCTRFGTYGINKAIECVNRKGEIILYQSILNSKNMLVDMNLIHYNEIKILGTIAQTVEDIKESILFMKKYFISFHCLTIESFEADEPIIAFDKALDLDINRVQIKFK